MDADSGPMRCEQEGRADALFPTQRTRPASRGYPVLTKVRRLNLPRATVYGTAH